MSVSCNESLDLAAVGALLHREAQPADGQILDNSELCAFTPVEPVSFQKAGLTDSDVESLVVKFLLAHGDVSGREIAEQVKLPFVLIDALLRQLKIEHVVVHRAAAQMNDFQYQLSDLGRERAQRYALHCSYFGSAPVPLKDYIVAVGAQSLTRQQPTVESLAAPFPISS